jgi:phosphotransferase system HPr-like phosphotransfer protein
VLGQRTLLRFPYLTLQAGEPVHHLLSRNEVKTMSAVTVYLPEITDVERFVNIMSRFPFEATLVVGSYSVDAKSIMGIFTLDREQPLRLEVATTDETSLHALAEALGTYLCNPVH